MKRDVSRVAMKDIAARAGVSLMSVSRALRNERGVSEKTRARIRKIASELGYRPNPLVGALMANLRGSRPKGAVETIAFITSHPTADGWRVSPTFQEYFYGARERAERLGFRLEEFWFHAENMPGPRLSGILRARGVRGAILCPHPVQGGRIDLRWSELAAIALGYSVQRPQLHRVTNHHLRTVRLALAKLSERGYQRIGLAMESHFDARVDHSWTSGFLGCQNQVPKEHRVPPLISPDLGRKRLDTWLSRYRPDAIVGGVPLEWVLESGFSVPDELGFAHLDYHPSKGNVAGVDQNSRAVGGAAVDLVTQQLYHNEFGLPSIPRVVMIEGQWREGPTVRSPSSATARVKSPSLRR